MNLYEMTTNAVALYDLLTNGEIDEQTFNDTLAAMIALNIGADMLVIISDVDGLYDKNPSEHKDAKLIPVVEDIETVRHLAGSSSSMFGTGGMVTKINAADIACGAGIDMVILNGSSPELMYDLFDGKSVGTYFIGRK